MPKPEDVHPEYLRQFKAEYGEILFISGQWWVMERGLFAPNGGEYYIPRDEAGYTREGDRVSHWIAHCAEKPWVNLRDLFDALHKADELYGQQAQIDWSATEAFIIERAYVECCYAEARRRLHTKDVLLVSELALQLAGSFWFPDRSPVE